MTSLDPVVASAGTTILGAASSNVNTSVTVAALQEVSSNLRVTFTVPTNGQVTVFAQAFCRFSNNNANANGFLGLKRPPFDVAGTVQLVIYAALASVGDGVLVNPFWTVTGLTPGSTETFSLGMAVDGGGSNTLSIPNVVSNGPARLVVTT